MTVKMLDKVKRVIACELDPRLVNNKSINYKFLELDFLIKCRERHIRGLWWLSRSS